MAKILSRAGASLADIYDVEGSIAGIDTLETRELPIVHEMGATVFSERFRTQIFRITTGALAQDIAFAVELTTLPEIPARLLGVQVIANVNARVALAAVLATDPTLGQDFPLWVFDSVAALQLTVAMEDAGAHANQRVLVPQAELTVFPAFVGGREQQGNMASSVTLSGLTSGFGAGTVTVTALLLLAFPRTDGPRRAPLGLPIPSW